MFALMHVLQFKTHCAVIRTRQCLQPRHDSRMVRSLCKLSWRVYHTHNEGKATCLDELYSACV
jgi:hypothetical protein